MREGGGEVKRDGNIYQLHRENDSRQPVTVRGGRSKVLVVLVVVVEKHPVRQRRTEFVSLFVA